MHIIKRYHNFKKKNTFYNFKKKYYYYTYNTLILFVIYAKRLTSVLNSVYKFLGICPYSRVPTKTIHPTAIESIPEDHNLNESTRNFLIEYFEPFNVLLDIISNQTLDSYSRLNTKHIQVL